MFSASGIEGFPASRTSRLAFQIFANGEFPAACATQYCPLPPLPFGPNRDRVICHRNVAILAGVVDATALYLDGDNVSRPVIMLATRVCVELHAPYFWTVRQSQFE